MYATLTFNLFTSHYTLAEFSTERNEEPRSSGTNSIVKTPSSGLIVSTILQTLLFKLITLIDEGSLSSERLQYSADPVQRVGTPSAGEDNQVRTRILGIIIS